MRQPVLVVAIAVVIHAAPPASADRRDWLGSAGCAACHPREAASWQKSAHATTAKRFSGRPPTRCLACHGTGEAPAGPTIAIEVGCEACHGAGAAYSEDDVMRSPQVARALGLIDVKVPRVRQAVCRACHERSPRGTVSDLARPVHAP